MAPCKRNPPATAAHVGSTARTRTTRAGTTRAGTPRPGTPRSGTPRPGTIRAGTPCAGNCGPGYHRAGTSRTRTPSQATETTETANTASAEQENKQKLRRRLIGRLIRKTTQDRNNCQMKPDFDFQNADPGYFELFCIIKEWRYEGADAKKDLGPVKKHHKCLKEYTTEAGITRRLISERIVLKECGHNLSWRVMMEQKGYFPKLHATAKESTTQSAAATSGGTEEEDDSDDIDDDDDDDEQSGDDDEDMEDAEQYEDDDDDMEEDATGVPPTSGDAKEGGPSVNDDDDSDDSDESDDEELHANHVKFVRQWRPFPQYDG